MKSGSEEFKGWNGATVLVRGEGSETPYLSLRFPDGMLRILVRVEQDWTKSVRPDGRIERPRFDRSELFTPREHDGQFEFPNEGLAFDDEDPLTVTAEMHCPEGVYARVIRINSPLPGFEHPEKPLGKEELGAVEDVLHFGSYPPPPETP